MLKLPVRFFLSLNARGSDPRELKGTGSWELRGLCGGFGEEFDREREEQVWKKAPGAAGSSAGLWFG